MKKENKKCSPKKKNVKNKNRPISAEDIFALNSLNLVNNVDSHINDLLLNELNKYNKLGFVFTEYYISFLPYIIYWLTKINTIDYSLPLNNYISIESIKKLDFKCNEKLNSLGKFLDLLRFENIFKENILKCGSKEKITNIIILNNIFFENIQNTNLKFDLYLELPKSIFEQNDHLNYLYFIKRGAFIYKLYIELEKIVTKTPNFNDEKMNSYIISFIERIFKSNDCINIPENLIKNIIKNRGIYYKVKVEVDHLNGLSYLPIIIITFALTSPNNNLNIKVDNSPSFVPKYITFRFHTIYTKNEGLNDTKNIPLFRNSVNRSVINNDSYIYPSNLNSCLLPPTPQYNGAILNESYDFYKKTGYKSKIKNTVLNNSILLNTFILLKIWCIKNGIWDDRYINSINNVGNTLKNSVDNGLNIEDYRLTGQLNSEIILCFLFHSYVLSKKLIDDSLVSPFQLFKIVLTNIKNMINKWKSSLNSGDDNKNTGVYYVIGKSEPKSFSRVFIENDDYLKKNNSLNLFNRDFICRQVLIFFDKQKIHNVLWRCQDLIKNELENIITSTLSFIENKNMINYSDNILKLFNIIDSKDSFINCRNISILDYDSCFMLASHGGNTVNGIQLKLAHTIPGDYNAKKIDLSKFNYLNSNIINEEANITRDFNSIWENSRSTNLVDILRNLFNRCFVDRLKTLSLREITSSRGSFGCIIGIKFEQTIIKYLIKGPAVNTKEAKIFKEFWDDKVDTRRFRDGTVLETVIWDSKLKHKENFVNNNNVNLDIVNYILRKHLPVTNCDNINKTQPDCNNLVFYYLNTPFGYILPYNKDEKFIIEEFNNFKSKILNLKSIPLKIKSITTSSPTLRFMEYYKYINLKDKPNINEISDNENYNYTGIITEIPCVIELEQSSNWPKTKSSINKIKAAFLLQIKEELDELYLINSDIIPNDELYEEYNTSDSTRESNIFEGITDYCGLKPFLDIYWGNNITFRVSIFHSNEFLNISKNILNLDNITSDLIKNNIYMDENKLKEINQLRNLWWSVQLSSRLSNISNCFPSFRGTVKKLKEFASIIKIPNSEEFIEHVASHVYTNNDFVNNFYGSVNSPTCGFIRSLILISEYNWKKEPLIVDLDFQLDENGIETCINNNDYKSLDRIHTYYYNFTNKHNIERKLFYVSSLIDPQSLFIRVPNNYNSFRFVYLSKMFLNIIMANQFYFQVDKINDILLYNTPKCDIVITLNENYKQIIQPKSHSLNPKIGPKLSSKGLQNKYVNLNSTEDLLKRANIKSDPLNVSKELFYAFILDIQKYFGHRVDLIYDSYTIPYPKHVYIKVSNGIIRTDKTIYKKNTYPECIFSLTNQLTNVNSNNFLALPNILEITSYLSRKYSELIANIKIS
ncbi:hypothetical protein RS030_101616 [Cryptosporidium xiaoi]|uniref:Uncharacterized protein n=1 Tax=Cryptosporidium xiaoi TaxID=659607 RepID=A0AAV9Y5A0_9CRYT